MPNVIGSNLDLVEDVDGIPLGPLLMIERLNQACEQVAGFAGQIFATSPDQQAAADDIPANA